MKLFTQTVRATFLAAALLHAAVASADDEVDALKLESDTSATPQAGKDTKIFVEGALGTSDQRYLLGSKTTGRASIDFSHTAKLAPGWRAVFSDRLDHIYPVAAGADSNINSLREAYISWQPEGGNSVLEVGRVNLRFGPGYGFNPTDYFRAGSLRTLTTADPVALRENRLGTVMLRGQRLWADGSLSLVFAPKLANRPDRDGWSLDLGSTNSRDRALVVLGTQFSQSISAQFLAYKEDGLSTSVGANFTALLSDAAVAHLEWSRGREPRLIDRATGVPGMRETRNRFTGGVTYTTLGKLSFTAEYLYNGFALNRQGLAALGPVPLAQFAYFGESLRLLDLAPRQAYMFYVSQKSLGLKNLDLTAFLRINAEDRSRLAWVELRHHWSNFDLAFQLQHNMGRANSEFGVLPDRRVIQVLGTYYF